MPSRTIFRPTGDGQVAIGWIALRRAVSSISLKFVVGSEGTLVALTEIEVGLVPIPHAVTACAGHFTSMAKAMVATQSAIAEGAAVIEMVDDLILGLARTSRPRQQAISLVEGEPAALLLAEFHAQDNAEAVARRRALDRRWRQDGAYAVLSAGTPAEVNQLRELRKAGLGLLMAAGRGHERSLAFIEDTAVEPRHLPEYVQRFSDVLRRHDLRAGFYGHASAGCLHIRPFMSLRRPGEVARMRGIADEIRQLVSGYGGSNSSEHGDGLARSEFNRLVYGDRLYEAMRQVKRIFDPDARMNPGKIVDAPAMTDSLHDVTIGPPPSLPTHFAFENGMRDAANACMRIGQCRKGPAAPGTMCPSYMATREEEHSTRGRANALVRALSAPDPIAALGDHDLHRVLDLCLECKACKVECPLSVDMATLKSETLAHYHEQHGTPARARLFAKARAINKLGSRYAPVVNWLNRQVLFRSALERFAGIDRRRPLPQFQRTTLERWYRKHGGAPAPALNPDVVVLADSFTSFGEPRIGRAAIELLELAGLNVELETSACCGRAAFSKGLLSDAKASAAALLDRLSPWTDRRVPIVGWEPSCMSTLRDEYAGVFPNDERAHSLAQNSFLIQEVLLAAVDNGSLVLDESWLGAGHRILFHGHCHEKAVMGSQHSVALLERLPGCEVVALDAGCCGMAGSFGFEKEHYDLSMRIGELRLLPSIRLEPSETILVATGVSCRQHITHGTGRSALHPIELLRMAVKTP